MPCADFCMSVLSSHRQEKAGASGVTGPKCWAQIWSGGGSDLSAFLSNTEPTVTTAPGLKYSGLGCCFCVSQVSFIKATSRTACRVSAGVIWLGGKQQPGRCSLFPLPCIPCSALAQSPRGTACSPCTSWGWCSPKAQHGALFAAEPVLVPGRSLRWPQTCCGAGAVGRLCSLTLSFCSSSGANVNAKDTVWLTPLHRAAASRNEVGSLCCASGFIGSLHGGAGR